MTLILILPYRAGDFDHDSYFDLAIRAGDSFNHDPYFDLAKAAFFNKRSADKHELKIRVYFDPARRGDR